MLRSSLANEPRNFVFLLVPNFSLMAFTSALEPLRSANRLADKVLYRWRIVSVDGKPVTSSSGISVNPDSGLPETARIDAAFVCAGLQAENYTDKEAFAWLRAVSARGATIGGVCTGALIMARAGLLSNNKCTIHWENIAGFVEEFPDLDITATLFEVDGKRATCSGGTAPLDMMLNIIATDHGQELALNVAEQLLHNIIRHPHDPQRMSLQHRTGISNGKVLAVLAHMEAFLENPVSLEELSDTAGVSPRQLERLFRNHLGKSPKRYYMDLRLKRAKLLLTQTSMPILQVAVACGFTSASHFARCYRALFGRSPRMERWLANAVVDRENPERLPEDQAIDGEMVSEDAG